ncbi:HAD-IIA family hydrolase [Clostridium ganghwense]|uniref:Acid sugar phosphatase n=1 Tax=Clostridium ganghwense TaxID=312089 RepID=A0ABT4CUR5_9CLOT|nr:HAD-IIA family hydrolase [Clostridium ganghwense]MCY6372818.1 HAD-IIA family hydrolase [Clostridium ganghwense]
MKELKYLIDLDGTIYRGAEPIEYAKEFINYLKKNNRKFLIVTNCPFNDPKGVVNKLANMDIEVSEKNVLTSGQATAAYMYKNKVAKTVFVIGSEALKNEFVIRGFQLVDENPDAVVVGYDKYFDYKKMTKAVQAIMNGAKFICTNEDNIIPDGDKIVPHTGAIAKSIECATNKKPLMIGKPEKYIVDEALDILGSDKNECCIIGDRLDTDILTGVNHGLYCYLVLTGVTCKEQLYSSEIKPTRVFKNLREIMVCDKGK